MTANMREALEAAEGFISDICPDDLRLSEIEERRTVLAKIDAALSAVPAPVSEEEIADIICNCFNGDMTFNECAKLVISRLSRTEGEWRPDPKTVEACARRVETCAIRYSQVFRGKLQDQIDVARQDVAEAVRSLLDQPDPEESIRTRLDEQAVKSSGGVRTSTENL